MRRIVIAGIAAIIVVAIAVIAVLQYYALSNLQQIQFSPRSLGNFDFEAYTLDMQIDACNPTEFPTGFDQIRFQLDNRSKEFASLTLQGDTLMPKEAVTLNGQLRINAESVEHFWWKVYNIYTSFNPDNLSLKVTLETRILGLIPVSVDRDFNYDEFVALLVSPQATQFSCK